MKNTIITIIGLIILTIAILVKIPTAYYKMENIIIIIIGLIILTIAALVKIPAAYYGVEILFGKRTGRKFKEGLRLKVPFFTKVLLFSKSLKTYTFNDHEAIVVFSADNMEITIEGSVQLRPSWKNLLKFVEIPESTIITGMKDAVESGLGIIAGQEDGEDFIRHRKEIEYIINCLFSLERRPDFYLNGLDSDSFNLKKESSYKNYINKLEERSTKEKDLSGLSKIEKLKEAIWIVNHKVTDSEELDVLNFYKKNIRQIEVMLQLGRTSEENSEIENLYAIDIATFKLAKVSFSKETKESLEKRIQAEKDLEAFALRQDQKMEVLNELLEKGVPPEQASSDADSMVGINPKKTQHILGLNKGTLPLINIGGK